MGCWDVGHHYVMYVGLYDVGDMGCWAYNSTVRPFGLTCLLYDVGCVGLYDVGDMGIWGVGM